jgi:hypothetical protein
MERGWDANRIVAQITGGSRIGAARTLRPREAGALPAVEASVLRITLETYAKLVQCAPRRPPSTSRAAAASAASTTYGGGRKRAARGASEHWTVGATPPAC